MSSVITTVNTAGAAAVAINSSKEKRLKNNINICIEKHCDNMPENEIGKCITECLDKRLYNEEAGSRSETGSWAPTVVIVVFIVVMFYLMGKEFRLF